MVGSRNGNDSSGDFRGHFADREEAALLLAKKLANCELQDPVIVAIPRGAVQMAKIIAQNTGGVSDVVLVRKIGHPKNPDFSVGAVTEEGQIFLHDGAKKSGLKLEDIRPLALAAIQEIERQRMIFTPERKALSLLGREVVIVDDGIATGATMRAAIQSARASGAERIVVASPVASRAAVESLIDEGVEIVLLALPPVFVSVSQFYERFTEVEDSDVVAALSRADVFVSLQ